MIVRRWVRRELTRIGRKPRDPELAWAEVGAPGTRSEIDCCILSWLVMLCAQVFHVLSISISFFSFEFKVPRTEFHFSEGTNSSHDCSGFKEQLA